MPTVNPLKAGLVKAAAWLKGKIRNDATLVEGPFTLADPNLVRALTGVITAAGKPVTRDTALRCASFFSGVKMLANDVAKMPVIMFERTLAKGGRQRTSKALKQPLYWLLKDVPNPWMTAFQLRWIQVFHLFFEGNFYIQKVEDGAGRPLQLMPLNPWYITKRWETKPEPQLFFDYNDGVRQQTFTQDQIWWNSILNCYAPTDGVAIIALAREALSVMMASDEIAGKYFANGMFASGFITSDKDAEVDTVEAQNLVEKLARFYSGSGNAGKFTFMPYGSKFEKMVFTAEESQLLESRKWNAEEVVRLLGGAPLLVKLGYGEKNSTYASSSAFLEEYFNTSLMPITVNIEQSVLRDLIDVQDRGRFYVKYDADVTLRGSPRERAETNKVLIDTGQRTPNECRLGDDMDDIDGNDYLHVNANCILKDGELITVGVRGVGNQEEPTKEGQVTKSQPVPGTPQARLQELGELLAERILRKEEREQKVNPAFIAQVLGIEEYGVSQYAAERPNLSREQAKEKLIELATGGTYADEIPAPQS